MLPTTNERMQLYLDLFRKKCVHVSRYVEQASQSTDQRRRNIFDILTIDTNGLNTFACRINETFKKLQTVNAQDQANQEYLVRAYASMVRYQRGAAPSVIIEWLSQIPRPVNPTGLTHQIMEFSTENHLCDLSIVFPGTHGIVFAPSRKEYERFFSSNRFHLVYCKNGTRVLYGLYRVFRVAQPRVVHVEGEPTPMDQENPGIPHQKAETSVPYLLLQCIERPFAVDDPPSLNSQVNTQYTKMDSSGVNHGQKVVQENLPVNGYVSNVPQVPNAAPHQPPQPSDLYPAIYQTMSGTNTSDVPVPRPHTDKSFIRSFTEEKFVPQQVPASMSTWDDVYQPPWMQVPGPDSEPLPPPPLTIPSQTSAPPNPPGSTLGTNASTFVFNRLKMTSRTSSLLQPITNHSFAEASPDSISMNSLPQASTSTLPLTASNGLNNRPGRNNGWSNAVYENQENLV
ncbi:hypothetical protein B0H34DRAFT_794575 [Crassisporium funariophilum]|nr:hypothetical protein B0H34DRAFT_794575 [Crassisporium funariophilum]